MHSPAPPMGALLLAKSAVRQVSVLLASGPVAVVRVDPVPVRGYACSSVTAIRLYGFE